MKRIYAVMATVVLTLSWIAFAEEKPAADNEAKAPTGNRPNTSEAGQAKAAIGNANPGQAANKRRVMPQAEILKGSAGHMGTFNLKNSQSTSNNDQPISKNGQRIKPTPSGEKIAGLSTPRPVDNIFAPDDRVAVTSHRYPWRVIGTVNTKGEYGTGALVSPNLVLTCAHVVIDPDTKSLQEGLGYFYANLVDDQYLRKSWITRVWWGTNDPQNYRESDWALCKLEEPLGDELGWMGVASTVSFDSASDYPSPLNLAGYSGDFDHGWTATDDDDAIIQEIRAGLLLHSGNTTRGSSGAPLFRMATSASGVTSSLIYGLNCAENRAGGTTSLQVSGGYDERYANYAVPTTAFLPKLNELITPQP